MRFTARSERPATKCLMQRAVAVFGDARYERLAGISVAHLYNLRRRSGYETKRRHWTKTRGHRVPIAAHRAPSPDNRAGFIRIDSVHQGDQDGVKGVYHPKSGSSLFTAKDARDANTACQSWT